MLVMLQSGQVLGHDVAQVLPVIWNLQRNNQTGVSIKGYGSSGMDSLQAT